ncbi:hypothetical protein [Bradyrhizobium viridifuturi]|uniref:hypothetical protein n=1 Tax=Bradyrhizobium viridifuturi TaxID=1654716 RepID=UPI00067F3963|nr:hypothetical protein [Bradyrhizobium viridifuturi]
MNLKRPSIVLSVSSPTAVSRGGSIIVLEGTAEDDAMNVAAKIAQETGRSVTVRGVDMRVLATISAPSIN